MPCAIEVDRHGIQAVADVGAVLVNLLRRAESVKHTASIEPPLEWSDLGPLQDDLAQVLPKLEHDSPQPMRAHQYGIIETAVRDIFGKFVAATSIESPDFVRVWNLLDLVSILSEMRQCDPALLFWLIEELLDSQTTTGCRRILDFLESRRQRITANPSVAMQLTILRSCNELLRRLSRARDTTFCGRVFIFMFQSFPLGDRSSVNLRGEYHVENVTTFDQGPSRNSDAMVTDDSAGVAVSVKTNPANLASDPYDEKANGVRKHMDALYPVFWSLQASFSQPKKLFDRKHFEDFKHGLEFTLAAFRDAQARQPSRSQKQEDPRTAQKRKREAERADLADTFNPKYLTSRDLFELELSDLTFRRYILVQALIIMEFLLSLSTEAKEIAAVAGAPNKSVIYSDQELSSDDAEWAKKTMREIIDQLETSGSSPNEGFYFVRIVRTILGRDKNWVRWKMYACSPIEMSPMPPQAFAEAKQSAHRSAISKRMRATAMNALSIDFLGENRDSAALDIFKPADRYQVPEARTFKQRIAEDELEIDLPTNSQTKAAAIEGKASKIWRALRVASRSQLAVFDEIEDADKVGLVFEDKALPQSTDTADGLLQGDWPSDTRPVILSGPRAAGKSSLIELLLERKPGIFQRIRTHTTRTPKVGDTEQNADCYVRVDVNTFNTMIDGDQFLESCIIDGDYFGISRRDAESVSESGKIALMEMSIDGGRQSRETSFAARYVLVRPSDVCMLQTRLEGRGMTSDRVAGTLEEAKQDMDRPEGEGVYDELVISDDLEVAYRALERFIYGQAVLIQDGQPGAGEVAQD